ncbi:glycosyltransferase [soil metagenome]
MADPSFDIVVPTIGRPSLPALLEAIAVGEGALPSRIFLVDDRRDPSGPLTEGSFPPRLTGRIQVLSGGGAGPAAARNCGWRASSAPWIAFVDDDVVPPRGWLTSLSEDLRELPSDVAGSQGAIRVPVASDRRPTDWERNVQGLERARWATADMAYRRRVLEEVGGFDERFPRAYREDADLALRVLESGYRLVRGQRHVLHPVRPADWWVSVRLQAGNADDALMRALHGPAWRTKAGVAAGRRGRHLLVTGLAFAALGGFAARRRSLARIAAIGWLAGTAELAWERVAPGPRTPAEVGTMSATSAVLPVAAAYHWAWGVARSRGAVPWTGSETIRGETVRGEMIPAEGLAG